MIAVLSYQFHDNERRIFTIDSKKLNPKNPFEAVVKRAIEDFTNSHLALDGNQFDDNWGDLGRGGPRQTAVSLPCQVDRIVNIDVRFEE